MHDRRVTFSRISNIFMSLLTSVYDVVWPVRGPSHGVVRATTYLLIFFNLIIIIVIVIYLWVGA